MVKPIKGLLFDKDGTLFDFHKTWGVWCAQAINAMAADDAEVADRLAGVLMFDRISGSFLKESPVIAGTLGELVDMVHTVFPDREKVSLHEELRASATDIDMVPAVPLMPLLTVFKSRELRIGVATNDAESAALTQLDRAGLGGQFDFIAGYDSGYGGKPAPGQLLAFAQAVDLPPEQIVMVGDSTHDLDAGRAAGMRTIGVLTGSATADELEPHAHVVLRNIGDIPAWLEQQTKG